MSAPGRGGGCPPPCALDGPSPLLWVFQFWGILVSFNRVLVHLPGATLSISSLPSLSTCTPSCAGPCLSVLSSTHEPHLHCCIIPLGSSLPPSCPPHPWAVHLRAILDFKKMRSMVPAFCAGTQAYVALAASALAASTALVRPTSGSLPGEHRMPRLGSRGAALTQCSPCSWDSGKQWPSSCLCAPASMGLPSGGSPVRRSSTSGQSCHSGLVAPLAGGANLRF